MFDPTFPGIKHEVTPIHCHSCWLQGKVDVGAFPSLRLCSLQVPPTYTPVDCSREWAPIVPGRGSKQVSLD